MLKRQPQPFIQGTSTRIITIWGDRKQREAGWARGGREVGLGTDSLQILPGLPPSPALRTGLPPGQSSGLSALSTVRAYSSWATPHTSPHTEVRSPGVREEGALVSVKHARREKMSQSIKMSSENQKHNNTHRINDALFKTIFQAQTYNRLLTVCQGALTPPKCLRKKEIWTAHESNFHNQKIKGPGKVN